MRNLTENLTEEETKLFFNAPIYVALSAALEDGEITKAERRDAISLVHLRTFTSDPILHSYYKEAEVDFKEKLDEVISSLPEEKEDSRSLLESKMNSINSILTKVDSTFASELKRNLKSFAKHVANVNSSWIDLVTLFIDPVIAMKKSSNSDTTI